MSIAPLTALRSAIQFRQPSKAQPIPLVTRDGVEVVELVMGGLGWIWREEEWLEVTPDENSACARFAECSVKRLKRIATSITWSTACDAYRTMFVSRYWFVFWRDPASV